MSAVIDGLIASGPNASERVVRIQKPAPLTTAERSRRYRAKHQYGPDRSDYRHRFGRYDLAPFCESFVSDTCTGEEGLLLPHHVFYLSCPACRGDSSDGVEGDGQRGHCKNPEHLITVCRSCHMTIHKNAPRHGGELLIEADYRAAKDIRHMDAHMGELGMAAD